MWDAACPCACVFACVVCLCVCVLSSWHSSTNLSSIQIFHSDGKRPDSNSIVPWKCGQLLVWDATCPDTFAPCLIILHNCCIASWNSCSTGGEDIKKKIQKYKHLDSCHFFTPVAIETTGVFGPRTIEFLKELGVEVGV